MKGIVKLKWIEAKNEFHILSLRKLNFIYNLLGCKFMRMLFDNPSETDIETYVIDAHRLKKTK